MSTTGIVVIVGVDKRPERLIHNADAYPGYMVPILQQAYRNFVERKVPKYEEWQIWHGLQAEQITSYLAAADPDGFTSDTNCEMPLEQLRAKFTDFTYTIRVDPQGLRGNGMGTEEMEMIERGVRPRWTLQIEKRQVVMPKDQRRAFDRMNRAADKTGHATGIGIDPSKWRSRWVTILKPTDLTLLKPAMYGEAEAAAPEGPGPAAGPADFLELGG